MGRILSVLVVMIAVIGTGTPVRAQTADPNPGSITLTAGVDFPTTYFFRGIRQETHPKFTLWPYGDVGLALFSGDGGLKSVGLNFGVWNSVHTGSSGSTGSAEKLQYEEDFYATLSLGFGGNTSLATTYTAYTSPNGLFRTVKELSFKASVASRIAPYGLVALELGDKDAAGADGGNPGTYVELGVGPSWPLGGGKATLAVPIKVGLSAKDYYELSGKDNRFGFLDVGGLITVPLTGIPGSFGSWNIHGGADVLVFGDTTEALNAGTDGETSKARVIGLFGLGLTY